MKDCFLHHECCFLQPMRFFLTFSAHTRIWNKAAKEDYCSTQFYCIAAFFARLLWTAIHNSLADEAVLQVCSRISYYIDLGKRTSYFGGHTWYCGAEPTGMSTWVEHFTLLLVLLVWTVPYSLQQGTYPTPQFSTVPRRQSYKQHIWVVLLVCGCKRKFNCSFCMAGY